VPGSFRFAPGCGCCGVDCSITIGGFCDCCGTLTSGTLRLYNDSGFDKSFPVTQFGWVNATVHGAGTYHVQLTGPYPTKTLSDLVVTQTFNSYLNKWVCSTVPAYPQYQTYAPPDRPATLTVTTPDGTAVTLSPCSTSTSGCDAGQTGVYIGSTTVTLSHGCWCGTSSSITLPVVFAWYFDDFGSVYGIQGCWFQVWSPVCVPPQLTTFGQWSMSLCGFPVSAPGACVDPTGIIIPRPTGSTQPCYWYPFTAADLGQTNILDTSTMTCSPFYWRSKVIPVNPANKCYAPSALSFLWPAGGYLTVTP
jgi:hypothetical protein